MIDGVYFVVKNGRQKRQKQVKKWLRNIKMIKEAP